MAELRSESDYGTELDWDDESLEATLVAIEQRASFNRVNATATTALQHVPIEVEAQEESVGVAQSAGGAEEAEAAEDPDGGEMTALRPSRLWCVPPYEQPIQPGADDEFARQGAIPPAPRLGSFERVRLVRSVVVRSEAVPALRQAAVYVPD